MITFKRSIIAIALTGLFGCGGGDSGNSAPIPQPTPNQFEKFTSHWNSYFIGDSSKFDSELQSVVNKLNSNTKVWLKSHTLSDSGLWSDIKLDASNDSIGNQLNKTYQRLLTMAKVYNIKTTDLYRNQELKETIVSSLEYLNENFYNQETIQIGNWHNWQIGIPKNVNNTLLLMSDYIDPVIVFNYNKATEHFTPEPDQISVGGKPQIATGANLIDVAQVVLVRGVLSENESDIQRSISAVLPAVLFVDSGDGFYNDYSFIQHKDIAYTGTYGNELLKGLGMMVGAVSASEMDIDTQELDRIYPILLESFAPLIVDGRMMDFVNGRAISRTSGQTHKVGHSITNSMVFFIDGAPEEYKSKLKSFIKNQIVNDLEDDYFETVLNFSNYQTAKELLKDDSVKVVSNESHKQFVNMDRVVHHRNDYTFGIAMHSNRVGNYECINGENLKGWFTGDGATYLYNNQNHYTNYWVNVNPYLIAGTTVLNDVERIDCDGQRSEQKDGRQDLIEFAGGATLGNYGVSGFDFHNHDNSLSAKKSWFMFDNEIVSIGSDISDSNSKTVIENRKIESGMSYDIDNSQADSFKFSINVSGQENPINYIVLGDEPTIEKNCRSGDWSDIGTGKGSVSESCFVEATIDHNINQDYAYMILPNVSINEYVNPIVVLSKDSNAHVVNHTNLNIVSANFWKPATVGNITAKSAMSLLVKELDSEFIISISDPMRRYQSMHFELVGSGLVTEDLNDLVSVSGGVISVDLSNHNGESYTFKLSKEIQ